MELQDVENETEGEWIDWHKADETSRRNDIHKQTPTGSRMKRNYLPVISRWVLATLLPALLVALHM